MKKLFFISGAILMSVSTGMFFWTVFLYFRDGPITDEMRPSLPSTVALLEEYAFVSPVDFAPPYDLKKMNWYSYRSVYASDEKSAREFLRLNSLTITGSGFIIMLKPTGLGWWKPSLGMPQPDVRGDNKDFPKMPTKRGSPKRAYKSAQFENGLLYYQSDGPSNEGTGLREYLNKLFHE
jgi:hypothetical protein